MLCSFPSCIMLLFMSFMPETPRFLLSQSRRSEAVAALRFLRGPHADHEWECEQIEAGVQEEVTRISFTLENTFLYGCDTWGYQSLVNRLFCKRWPNLFSQTNDTQEASKILWIFFLYLSAVTVGCHQCTWVAVRLMILVWQLFTFLLYLAICRLAAHLWH